MKDSKTHAKNKFHQKPFPKNYVASKVIQTREGKLNSGTVEGSKAKLKNEHCVTTKG